MCWKWWKIDMPRIPYNAKFSFGCHTFQGGEGGGGQPSWYRIQLFFSPKILFEGSPYSSQIDSLSHKFFTQDMFPKIFLALGEKVVAKTPVTNRCARQGAEKERKDDSTFGQCWTSCSLVADKRCTRSWKGMKASKTFIGHCVTSCCWVAVGRLTMCYQGGLRFPIDFPSSKHCQIFINVSEHFWTYLRGQRFLLIFLLLNIAKYFDIQNLWI